MSICLCTKIVGLVLTAAAAVALIAPAAQATPVTYDFAVHLTGGPLYDIPSHSNTYTGSFSYDSSTATAASSNPYGLVQGLGLLTALNFSFNGVTYNAQNANTGALGFNSGGVFSGNLTLFNFGNDCHADGGCTIGWGSNDWWVGSSFEDPNNNFLYSKDGFEGVGNGVVTYAMAVMEPSNFGMFAFGLIALGVGVGAKRRKDAQRAEC